MPTCFTYSLSFSDGIYYLHFTCRNGPWHSKTVRDSCLSNLLYDLKSICFGFVRNVDCFYVKVQSRGSWTVCQHRPRVGHHRGLVDVVEFVPADGTQRPLDL